MMKGTRNDAEKWTGMEEWTGVQDMVIIPDSYINLIPFLCLLAEDGEFLGDRFSFRIMPSLITMGIVDQLHSVVVQVPTGSQNVCGGKSNSPNICVQQ